MKRIAFTLLAAVCLTFSSCTDDETTGEILFWSQVNFENGGVQIFLDDEFVGTLNNAFPTIDPACKEQGTLTVTKEPGTYQMSAVVNNTNREWNASIKVVANSCVDYLFEP